MATSKDSPTPGETNGDPTLDNGAAPGLLNIEPISVGTGTPMDPAAPEASTEPVQEDVHLKDIRGVRYIGPSDAQSFSVSDLTRVGVDPKGPLRWSRDNDKFVPKADINAATLAWLLTQPNDFRAE